MSAIFRNFAHTLAAITTNCSEFTRAWKEAEAALGVEGRWFGEWRSQANAHHGPLRGVLRRQGEEAFRADFHARYSKFLRVCYSVHLRAQRQGNLWRLEGEADLGQLAGGVYRYKGELSEERLHCTYQCRYDEGLFELRRMPWVRPSKHSTFPVSFRLAIHAIHLKDLEISRPIDNAVGFGARKESLPPPTNW